MSEYGPWSPRDEQPERRSLRHIVRRYEGDLPRGPCTWRDVVTLLLALGVCARDGRTLRPVPGHDIRQPGPGRPRGPSRKGQRVR